MLSPSVESGEAAIREQIRIVQRQLASQPDDPGLCETQAQLMQDVAYFQERVQGPPGRSGPSTGPTTPNGPTRNFTAGLMTILGQTTEAYTGKLLIMVTFFCWFRLSFFPEYVVLDAILLLADSDDNPLSDRIKRWSYIDVVLPGMLFNLCCWWQLPGGTVELANFVLEFSVSCINYAEWQRLFLTPRGYSRVDVLLTRIVAVVALEYADWRLLVLPEATHASVVGAIGLVLYYAACAVDRHDAFHELRMLSCKGYHAKRHALALGADEAVGMRRSVGEVHRACKWLHDHPKTSAVAGLAGTVPCQAKLEAAGNATATYDDAVAAGMDRSACEELLKCDAANLVLLCEESVTVDTVINGIHYAILAVWFCVGLFEPLRVAVASFLNLKADQYGWMVVYGMVLWGAVGFLMTRLELQSAWRQWAQRSMCAADGAHPTARVLDSSVSFSEFLPRCMSMIKSEGADKSQIFAAVCGAIPRLPPSSIKQCFCLFVDEALRPWSESGQQEAPEGPPSVLTALGLFAHATLPDDAVDFTTEQRRAVVHGSLTLLHTATSRQTHEGILAAVAATAGVCVCAHVGGNVPVVAVVGAGTPEVNGIYTSSTEQGIPLEFRKAYTQHLEQTPERFGDITLAFRESAAANIPTYRWRMGRSGAKSYMCKDRPGAGAFPPAEGWEVIGSLTKSYGKLPLPRVFKLG
jgi:hypothetical protein